MTSSAWLVPSACMTLVVVVATRLAPSPHRRPTMSGPDRPLDRLSRAPRAAVERWRALRRQRRAIEPSVLAAWIDDVSRAVRHGTTLRAALVDAVPDDESVRRATDLLRRRLERGATAADAAAEWLRSLDAADVDVDDCRHLRSVANVLTVAASTGGAIGDPLDRLAASLRQAAADELERYANAAQARLSARVLTLLPLGLLLLLVMVDADVRRVVVAPLGAAVVVCGLALNLLGARWMRRIIDRSGR